MLDCFLNYYFTIVGVVNYFLLLVINRLLRFFDHKIMLFGQKGGFF